MTEVTSITKTRLEVGGDYCWLYRYTKAGTGDVLTVTTEFGEVDMVISKTSAGADDPSTQSSEVITLSAGTGAGIAIVFGKPN